MVLAIPEAMIHSCAFSSFTAGLQEGHEKDLVKWKKMVREWEMDNEENPNPYDYVDVEGVSVPLATLLKVLIRTSAKTMTDVLAQIAEEEHQRFVRDGASALTVKPGPFLIEGISIQTTQ
jgi:hypothetical protein